jgi:hypothetical protein
MLARGVPGGGKLISISFIARREQRRVADLLGKLEWDESFDYNAERSRRK